MIREGPLNVFLPLPRRTNPQGWGDAIDSPPGSAATLILANGGRLGTFFLRALFPSPSAGPLRRVLRTQVLLHSGPRI